MIKGKSPFPFETIALAVSFAPGLPVLIEETKRLCDLHKATAIFIHVGKKTSEKQRELSNLLSAIGFNDCNSRLYWEPGDTVNTVLRICKHEVVDLLIAGSSDKSDFRLPVGSIASNLATKAKCSVLIFSGKPSGVFHNLVINGNEHRKTDLTIRTAIYFAEKENAHSIKIVDVEESDYASAGGYAEPIETQIAENNAVEQYTVKLNSVSLARENCTTVSEYAFKENADLLITYSSDHHLLIFDRISSSNGIESLLKDSPCSLLIVHSRIRD